MLHHGLCQKVPKTCLFYLMPVQNCNENSSNQRKLLVGWLTCGGLPSWHSLVASGRDGARLVPHAGTYLQLTIYVRPVQLRNARANSLRSGSHQDPLVDGVSLQLARQPRAVTRRAATGEARLAEGDQPIDRQVDTSLPDAWHGRRRWLASRAWPRCLRLALSWRSSSHGHPQSSVQLSSRESRADAFHGARRRASIGM